MPTPGRIFFAALTHRGLALGTITACLDGIALIGIETIGRWRRSIDIIDTTCISDTILKGCVIRKIRGANETYVDGEGTDGEKHTHDYFIVGWSYGADDPDEICIIMCN